MESYPMCEDFPRNWAQKSPMHMPKFELQGLFWEGRRNRVLYATFVCAGLLREGGRD